MPNNENENEEKFSDDPQENLKIENELLRLKMQAQFGDSFSMHGENSLPPEIENEFLNRVIAFENNYQKAEFITLGEKLGIDKPKSSEEMTEAEVTEALKNIEDALDKHHIYLDRIYGPYPDKLIYDFIVNELLAKEIEKVSPFTNVPEEYEDVEDNNEKQNENEIASLNEKEEERETEEEPQSVEGLPEELRVSLEEFFKEGAEDEEQAFPAFEFKNGTHYIYEDFHPNNEKDIEKNTIEFMRHWEQRSFNEYCTELGFELVTMDGKAITREVLYKKMFQFFDSFTSFENFKFMIAEISFAEQPDGSFMGHSEGAVKYDAVLENGEQMHFSGPYKLYMLREDNYWSIMHFVMEGFSWDGL